MLRARNVNEENDLQVTGYHSPLTLVLLIHYLHSVVPIVPQPQFGVTASQGETG